jgi:hypothetical protein
MVMNNTMPPKFAMHARHNRLIYYAQLAYNPAIFFNIADPSLPAAWKSAWNFDDMSAQVSQ